MTKPRTGQSGNWDRERADRLQEDVERMQKDVERLERWKAEATEVMSGLRELGKALGLGLGVQITGPAALAEVARLTAERDDLAAKVAQIEAMAESGVAAEAKAVEELEVTVAVVREYAKMRETYGKRGRTVHSSRVASDLFGIVGDDRRGDTATLSLLARLAAVEALADQWADRKRSDGMSGNAWIGLTLSGVAADLRAALATTGEGQ